MNAKYGVCFIGLTVILSRLLIPALAGLAATDGYLTYLPLVVRHVFVPSSGLLDASFDGDGMLITDLPSEFELGRSVAIQPDGKIVVGGYGAVAANDKAFILARYLPDGSLDTGFGEAGWVISNFDTAFEYLQDIALQTDGKILAAGHIGIPYAGTDFCLARYHPDGSLDTTFDGDGWLTVDVGGDDDYFPSLLVQPDGKLVLAGTAQEAYYGWTYFALARLNPDGSLDSSFGGDGKVILDFGIYSSEAGYAAALQEDGKIIVAGESTTVYPESSSGVALARVNPDGSLDTSFGDGGLVTTASYGHGSFIFDLLLQPDGKILAAGAMNNIQTYDFGLARYTPEGSLDASFDGDGLLSLDFFGFNDFGQALALQPDGRILLAGYADITDYMTARSVFAMARILTDGSLDSSFDGDGWLSTDFPGYDDEAYAIALQPDGKIVLAGNSGGYFALARYR
jgi:uncharacterized delta-60 repeat protein